MFARQWSAQSLVKAVDVASSLKDAVCDIGKHAGSWMRDYGLVLQWMHDAGVGQRVKAGEIACNVDTRQEDCVVEQGIDEVGANDLQVVEQAVMSGRIELLNEESQSEHKKEFDTLNRDKHVQSNVGDNHTQPNPERRLTVYCTPQV